MISSFWNLCRACPSMPVEKQLHSEYRSTFQWHEYVGNRADPSSLSQQHHQPQQHQPQLNQQLAVVRQPHRSTQSQVLWASAAKAAVEETSKRKRHPDILNRTSNGWITKSTADEIRCSQAVQLREKQADPVGAGGGPRKSISMGTIRATENVPVHSQQKLSNFTSIANAGISQPSLENRVPLDSNKETEPFEWTDRELKHDNTNMHFSKDVDDDRGGDHAPSREYLSEYKKRFRPFSQYEYVDGRFFKKKGDQEIGSPWFHEVIELRKKAGEYRHRGWGTELAPQHMAEVYNQQLWDQVSRRSSLAALALITTTTQRLSKEEKEKENVKRSHPTRSTSRPHTATPKHPLSDLRVDKQKDTEAVQKKKPLDGTAAVNRAARAKARSQSAGPGGRSPRKTARQIASSYGKAKEGPGGPGWKVQSDSGLVNSQAKPIQRHPRPSSADPSLGCYEPVVKSPPEPTRVKSPEQAILMSPDPVNWTVPLDTSKSFTVTQNIREGERFHGGDGRSIRHPLSGQHSSAGSTMASSPISARSAPVPIHSSGGPAAPTGLSSSAPGHNTIMERPSSKPSSIKEPIIKPKDYQTGRGHQSDSNTTNDHGTGGGSGGVTRKSSIEIKPHLRSQQTATTVNGVDERKRGGSSGTLAHHHLDNDKRQSSLEKSSAERDHHGKLHRTPSLTGSSSKVGSSLTSKTSSTASNSTTTASTKSATATASTTATTTIPTTTGPTTTTSTATTVATSSTASPSSKPKSSATSSSSGARNDPCAKPIPGTTLRCLEDPTFMFDPPKGASSPPPPVSSGGVRRLSSSSSPSVSSNVPPPSSASSSSVVSSGGGAVRQIPSHHVMPSGPSMSKSNIPPRSNIRILEAPDTATLHNKQSSIPTSTSLPSASSSSASAAPTAPSSASAISSSSIDFVPPAPVASSKRQVGAYQVSETPPPHAKRTTYRVLDAPEDTLYGAVPPPGGRSRASEVLDKARNRFDKFWGKTKDDEK